MESPDFDSNAPQTPTASALKPFFDDAHARKIPLNAQIQLTDLCNLRCEFCYNSQEHKRNELSYDEICGLLDQLRAAGTHYVCLTGGEATLHPRFFDIARAVRDRDFSLELITNATMLTEKHFAFFKEIGMHYIAVSLHGLQQASHERLTQTPESFNKTRRAIERMKELGLPVQLRIPVTRYNFDELDELLLYAEAMAISYRFDCNITFREDGDPTSIGPRLSEDELGSFYDSKWKQWLAAQKTPVTGHRNIDGVDGMTLCAAGHTYCYIDSVGTVHPCPSYQRPAGNIREQPFGDIWFGSDFFKKLRNTKYGDLAGCGGCGVKSYCNFCPGNARLEGDDKDYGFAKYPRACRDAEVNKRAYERIVMPQPAGV